MAKVKRYPREIKQLSELEKWAKNPRRITKQAFSGLRHSLETLGELQPIVWNSRTGRIVGGHQRYEALIALGEQEAEVVVVDFDEETEALANIALNNPAITGTFDDELLAEHLQALKLNEHYEPLLFSKLEQLDLSEGVKGSLAERFILPPFSVLNTQSGEWQERKRGWVSTGIESELGRESKLLSDATPRKGFGAGYDTKKGENAWGGHGTSIFDPVLCELMYTWFGFKGATVLDPFAGGSVRGLMAANCGLKYTGIELSEAQVKANRKQAKGYATKELTPKWVEGDSSKEVPKLKQKYDMLFSCPPYVDLEVYSEHPDDLSNMSHEQFIKTYRQIIKQCYGVLNDDRFAVFVVGEARDKKGAYYNFVGDTMRAFIDAGFSYYNELVLVNPPGSLPLRAGRIFNASRKIGKQHQNVLVFYKGNIKNIKQTYPELELPSESEQKD